MNDSSQNALRPHLLAAAACLFFFLAGQAFIPLLGVQNDEAYFGGALFQPHSDTPLLHAGHRHIPLMLMSYLGALKAWIYKPLFAIFGTGLWTLREPACMAGVASVWVFYLLLRRIAGARAALIGCSLLAVDAMYLLTACFDWGPVALQHLLLAGGCLNLLAFYQRGKWQTLALGAFLWGLAMWDKALAIWMLAAIGVASLAVLRKYVWRVITLRAVAIVALFFALGALPLIVYNYQNRYPTFGNQKYDWGELSHKALVLKLTADGSGLLGWMVRDDWEAPQPHAPSDPAQRLSRSISSLVGEVRRNLLLAAFALALLLAPLARGTELRAIGFSLIAMAVAWLQMAVTVNAGGSVRHAILLWPLPMVVIGVSFASASRRMGRAGAPALACVMAALLAAGVLQLNEYYRAAWRNGGSQNWSDAAFRLSAYMDGTYARKVYSVDWGITDSLRLLNRGSLPLENLFEAIPRDDAPPDAGRIREAISHPDSVFIAHVNGSEFFEGSQAKLLKAAAAAGYQREMMAQISDSWGRPFFEVYRFVGGS